MRRISKISIALMLFLFIECANYNFADSQTASNNNATKDLNNGEQYYLNGCDNLSFVNLYRHSSVSDKKLQADLEKHNNLAEADFSNAIALIPDCANAYWKRGRCKYFRWLWYGNPQDNQAGISDYKKAIALAPTCTEVRFNLLRAYASCGKRELAEQELKTILQLDPEPRQHKNKDHQMQK